MPANIMAMRWSLIQDDRAALTADILFLIYELCLLSIVYRLLLILSKCMVSIVGLGIYTGAVPFFSFFGGGGGAAFIRHVRDNRDYI